jgi:hypothetical protein
VQGLLGKVFALLGELDEYTAPVPRIRAAFDEPGPLEPVEARGHRPGGDQRRSDEIAGIRSLVVAAPTKGVQDVGGGPTEDKPTVTLEPPPDPDRASSFLNIRVADIQAVYAEWSARGAESGADRLGTRLAARIS